MSRRSYVQFGDRAAYLHVRKHLASQARISDFPTDEFEFLIWPLVKLLNAGAEREEIADVLEQQLTPIVAVPRQELDLLAEQLVARPYFTRLG